MTTHRALNEAPRPTSPGSRGGRDTEGRHGGRDRPSDVRRGGPKGDECDEDRGSRLERADEHGHGQHHPEGRDGRTHGVDAPPREGQTRAAGEHRADSSRLGPPAAVAQGVGDHEGGQSEGQHDIGDSCEPVRPALGAQPQASRSICRAAYLASAPRRTTPGQGRPTVRQMIENDSYTSGDRILMRLGGVAAILAFALGLWQHVTQTIEGQAVETSRPILGNLAYSAQISLMCLVVVGVVITHRRSAKTFGGVAAAVALIGGVLWSGSARAQLAGAVIENGGTVLPVLPDSAVIPTILVTFTPYWLGLLLMAIAALRARVLPRAASVLVLVGVFLALLPVNAPNLFDVYAFGIAWWGIAMLRAASSHGAAARARSGTDQAALRL